MEIVQKMRLTKVALADQVTFLLEKDPRGIWKHNEVTENIHQAEVL